MIFKFCIKLLIGQIRYQNCSNIFKKKKFNNPDSTYFLHIGKCAGTNLIYSFENKINLISVGHRYKLYSINENMKYIFSYRDPAERIYSAFYSIKNRGKPRHDWGSHNILQKFMFSIYDNFNDLAENLFSKKIIKRFLSKICLNIIFENHQPISTWFTIDELEKKKPIFIFNVSSIGEDLIKFNKKFNLDINLSSNSKIMNRSIENNKDNLSFIAKENLKRYLSEDYKIFNYLETKKEEINNLT